MTLDLLNLKYTYTEVNFHDGGTSSLDFIALNPQKSVPVLADSDLIINKSSAAITYLVSQYSPSQLYPECAKKRSQGSPDVGQPDDCWWICPGHLHDYC